MKTAMATLCLATAALFAGARGAQAREEFPGEIANHLGASVESPCGICHEYGKTGSDTLVTPFAWAMRARGLTGGGRTLTGALDRMRTDAVDSDGDSATDVDELIAGTDPNSAASVPPSAAFLRDPQLGCAMAGGTGLASGAWTTPVGLLLAALVWKRRARTGQGILRGPDGISRPDTEGGRVPICSSMTREKNGALDSEGWLSSK